MIFKAATTLQIAPSLLGDSETLPWLNVLRDELNGIQLQVPLWYGESATVNLKVQHPRFLQKEGKRHPQVDVLGIANGFDLVLSTSEEISEQSLTTYKVKASNESTWREETQSLEAGVESATERIAGDLWRITSDIALAAYLSAPGAFDTRACTVSINGRKQKDPERGRIALGLVPPVNHSKRTDGWPPIAKISFLDSFNWLVCIEGFAHGLPSGPSGRAISALTHLLEGNGLELVWAVLGLEALYCRGNKDLAHQLRQKTSALLGEPVEYKKRVQELYDHRSQLVHGGLDIPIAYDFIEVVESVERYQQRDMDSHDLGTTLLVSTIQHLILKRGYSIESDFTVRVV